MGQLSAESLRVTQLNNQTLPDEGPKAVPLILNFDATTDTIDLDFGQRQQQGWLSMVQSIYIDAKDAANPVSVTFESSNQKITAKPQTQGYYSALCPNPVKMRFTALMNTGIVTVYLINVPVAGAVWATI